MKFSDLSLEESLETLNLIKSIAKSNECKKISFNRNDMLFVDNRFVMHGRLKFNEVNRCLHRIQILPKTNTYDL